MVFPPKALSVLTRSWGTLHLCGPPAPLSIATGPPPFAIQEKFKNKFFLSSRMKVTGGSKSGDGGGLQEDEPSVCFSNHGFGQQRNHTGLWVRGRRECVFPLLLGPGRLPDPGEEVAMGRVRHPARPHVTETAVLLEYQQGPQHSGGGP